MAKLFLECSFDCQNFVHHNCDFLPILGPLLVQGFILKEVLQFSNLFQNTIFIGVFTLKCTKRRFNPLTPPPPLLQEALNMPLGMYCSIRLLEIMRLSAFKSPLFYPSSQLKTHMAFMLVSQVPFSYSNILLELLAQCTQVIVSVVPNSNDKNAPFYFGLFTKQV